MESVGLKEWAIVCEAMGRGKQCVILRKGGIAEGREGFTFRYPEFFLVPTFFHEQAGKVRLKSPDIPQERSGEIEIRFWAKLIETSRIASLEMALALEPLHILDRSVVNERFKDDRMLGLHVALLRVFRVKPAWILSDSPRFGGCRSWINLPERSSEIQFEPVLTDREHDGRVQQFHELGR